MKYPASFNKHAKQENSLVKAAETRYIFILKAFQHYILYNEGAGFKVLGSGYLKFPVVAILEKRT
jgi:hypothetical protein